MSRDLWQKSNSLGSFRVVSSMSGLFQVLIFWRIHVSRSEESFQMVYYFHDFSPYLISKVFEYAGKLE